MATTRLSETSRQRLNEAWEGHDPEAVRRYAVPLGRRPTAPGATGLAACARALLRVVPDLRFDVETQAVEGDAVVTRWTARGTVRGESVEVSGTTTHRYASGASATVTALWDATALVPFL